MIDETREELTALWATITVLRQLNGNKAKGEHLLEAFTKNPKIRQWFCLAYDGKLQYPLTVEQFHTNACAGDPNDLLSLRWAFKKAAEGLITPQQFHFNLIYHTTEAAKEIGKIIEMVLDRNLRCGVDGVLLNKVLARLEKPPIDIIPARDYRVVISTDGQFSHNGTLMNGNAKVAHIMFEPGVDVRRVLDNVFWPAVIIEFPKYAKG